VEYSSGSGGDSPGVETLRGSLGRAPAPRRSEIVGTVRCSGPRQRKSCRDGLQLVADSQHWTFHAALALLGDKNLIMADGGDGFLMYGVSGRSWVALGDPFGPEAVQRELAWRFRETADEHGAWPVFYEVSSRHLPLYIDLGLTLLKMGEEAIVPLQSFSLDGPGRKGLRRTQRDLQKAGASFAIVPAAEVPALMNELRVISDDWLAAKATREKRFSLGRFDPAYLVHFPVALVRVNGRLVAFANLWTGSGVEVSVDLMRYSSEAPSGVMEYLFIELMSWGRANGFERMSLGMAPLSGLEDRACSAGTDSVECCTGMAGTTTTFRACGNTGEVRSRLGASIPRHSGLALRGCSLTSRRSFQVESRDSSPGSATSLEVIAADPCCASAA
jgi:lysylphosphatidylglycerol synthetase-like protein (DUF2156 family)